MAVLEIRKKKCILESRMLILSGGYVNKSQILRILNPVIAVDFFCLVCTALLHGVIPYEIYGILHPVLGYILTAGIVCHLILNWSWIKSNYLSKKS